MSLSNHPEHSPEVREYSYDEGVAEVVSRISTLFETKDAIFVAVNGQDQHVGKTRITMDLLHRKDALHSPDIIWLYIKNFDSWDIEGVIRNAMYARHLQPSARKYILIMEQAEIYRRNDTPFHQRNNDNFHEKVRTIGELINLPLRETDLLISICRPDRKFHDAQDPSSMNEILIVNEKAVDKIL